MGNKRCTILINSCDAFSDVWELFFAGLKHQWPDCKYPMLLNVESKEYPNEIGVKVCHFVNSRKDCWGKRYKNALKQIDTPYVLPLLEDFVLMERFKGEELLEKVMDWMDKDLKIGVFYLHKHPYVLQKETEYAGFGLMPKRAEYKLTTGVGIWRKEYLDKCIKGIESPWEWELYSTKRAWRFSEKEYALLEGQEDPYVFPWGGVIWRGLWHVEAIKLSEKYDVNIDFGKRGFMDISDPYRKGEEYSVRSHFPKDIFRKKLWKEIRHRVYQKYRKVICRL